MVIAKNSLMKPHSPMSWRLKGISFIGLPFLAVTAFSRARLGIGWRTLAGRFRSLLQPARCRDDGRDALDGARRAERPIPPLLLRYHAQTGHDDFLGDWRIKPCSGMESREEIAAAPPALTPAVGTRLGHAHESQPRFRTALPPELGMDTERTEGGECALNAATQIAAPPAAGTLGC